MISVLLAEDMRNSQSAFEKTLKRENGIELVGVSRDGYETLECLNTYDIDLLLIDLILSGIDGLEVMRCMKRMNMPNPPTIIVITALSSERIINDAANLGAVHAFLKPCDASHTVKRILEVYEHAVSTVIQICGMNFAISEIQRIIVSALRDVGMPPQLLGYEYLRSAILESIQHQDLLHGVTTHLYPKVAQLHNSTPVKIERSIRHAIETTWNRSSVDALHKLFGYSVDTRSGRPTNSEFIARMTDIVAMRCV